MYIVDYDIPRESPSKRVQFYRDLKRMSNSLKYSTRSVLYTKERELAEAVYWLVIAYNGTANMYKGEEILLM